MVSQNNVLYVLSVHLEGRGEGVQIYLCISSVVVESVGTVQKVEHLQKEKNS